MDSKSPYKKFFTVSALVLFFACVSTAQESVFLSTADLSPPELKDRAQQLLEASERLRNSNPSLAPLGTTRVQSDQVGKKRGWSNYKKQLEVKNTYMLNHQRPVFRSDEVDEIQSSVYAGVSSTQRISPNWNFSVDVGYLFSPQEQRGYPNPREVYVEYENRGQKFTLGKKLQNWSLLDEEWELGIWQPRFQWQKIRTEQQGLGGLYYESRITKNISTTLFASPVFVPEFGPSFRLKDGSFIAKNPWFAPPVKRVSIPGLYEAEQIHFEIDTPPVQNIVFKPSFASKIQWASGATQCAAAYAFKPVNQVRLSFLGGGKLKGDRVEVTVLPEFTTHQSANIECGQKLTEKLYGWVSLGGETFGDQPSVKENTTYQVWKDSFYASSLLGYKINSNFEIYGSQLFTANAVQEDVGEFANSGDTYFENRIRYIEAARLGVKSKWRLAKSEMTFDMAGTYDFAVSGGTLLSELRWRNRSQLSLFLQADMIGLLTEEEPASPGSFIETYRANDQVSAGVGYVF